MLDYDCVPSGYIAVAEVYRSARTLVLRAQQTDTGTSVVLKTTTEAIPPAALLQRYDHEWTLLSSLLSDPAGAQPNIIRAHELTRVGHRPVLIVEDFGGQALRHLVASYAHLPLTERLSIAIAILDALEAIHIQGILHKDINPSNVVVNRTTGQVKLIDFGIAVRGRRIAVQHGAADTFEGTLDYIAPEQTGRMSCPIDARADLYAFGVLLYELLTGTVPFRARDTLEIIHAHLALVPPPVQQRNPQIPTPLSDIVAKLLAKSPDDRYQMAAGVRADLVECQRQLASNEPHHKPTIRPFPLGQYDIRTFVVPKRLYGREREIALLREAFDRISQTGCEMVLVTGPSGIGKTALIAELHIPVTAQRGFFIAGKYEQLRGSTPYSGLGLALRQLVRQLLARSDAELESWRQAISAALGTSAATLLPIVPDLALIIGESAPVCEISGMEARYRLERALEGLLSVFAARQHPLVLFLDDVQWADAASLELLAALARNRQRLQALIILAQRNQTESAGHPLPLALDTIRSTGIALTYITLKPLELDSVQQLTAAAMGDTADAAAVAEIIHRKTGGNPFFVRELLEHLAAGGWLTFQPGAGWRADLEGITTAALTENVVAFLIEKLHRCPPAVQQILHAAACLGSRFDVAQAALAAETDVPSAQAALEAAVAADLLLVESTAGRRADRFAFVHDGVQQAAYELAPEAERRARHWRIGRRLLSTSPSSRSEPSRSSFAMRLFDLVNHLNRGREQATAEERQEVAHLNLHAGRAAKAAAAFAPALEYFQVGLELLPPDAWSNHYDLTLHLYLAAAEAAFLSANPQVAQALTETVFQHARTLPDALPAHEIAILAYSAQYQFHAALNHARTALEALGIVLPEQPTPADVGTLWGRLRPHIPTLNEETLLSLPEMQNPQVLAASRLLYRMSLPAFLSNSTLFTLVTMWRVLLVLEHGTSNLSASSFVALGLVVSSGFQDPAQGYALGCLARRLLDHYPTSEARVRALVSYYFFLSIWREPAQDCIQPLRTAYQEAIETGDLEFASTALLAITWIGIFIGHPLDSLERDTQKRAEALRALRQERNYRTNNLCLSYIRNLRTQTDNPVQITWGEGDQAMNDAAVAATGDYGTLGTLAYLRMKLAWLFGDNQRAYAQSLMCEANMTGLQSSCLQPNVYLFGALTRLARLRSGDVTDTETQEMRDWLADARRRMEHWAALAPMNYAQKLHLMDAEMHALRGDIGAALEAYDQAIATARENGFIHEEALANECAARFFLDQKRPKIARVYAQEARRAYVRWGATEKVRHFDEQYGALLTEPDLMRSTGTHMGLLTTSVPTDSTSSGGSLDMASIMKAARVLAGEIVQERLLEALLKIALENAGATRGVLVLPREDGRWYVEAERDVHHSAATTPTPRLVEEVDTLPLSIIHLVLRTGEGIFLEDATESPDFSHDPYIQAVGLRSALCLPARHRGQVRALLYLENRAVANVFHAQRREALTILTAQTAVSLENARLYASLEEKVRQRTEELAEKNRRLQQTTTEILDGIRYAERIQRAILPTPEDFTRAFAEHFVLWRPRDIVSGDFYWLHCWCTAGRETRWLAVADCTGHGVPGALMSMIGNELLNQIVIERGIESPAAILDALDAGVRAALRHDARQEGQRDGMDIALCRLEPDGIVTFAGAGRPLYVVEQGLLQEIRGDRGGIGSRKRQRYFTEHRLHLPLGAMLYLCSDGFADQNNPQGERYGSKRLKQMLQSLALQALPLQQQHIERSLDEHSTGEPQRDDVTLVGIRISY